MERRFVKEVNDTISKKVVVNISMIILSLLAVYSFINVQSLKDTLLYVDELNMNKFLCWFSSSLVLMYAFYSFCKSEKLV